MQDSRSLGSTCIHAGLLSPAKGSSQPQTCAIFRRASPRISAASATTGEGGRAASAAAASPAPPPPPCCSSGSSGAGTACSGSTSLASPGRCMAAADSMCSSAREAQLESFRSVETARSCSQGIQPAACTSVAPALSDASMASRRTAWRWMHSGTPSSTYAPAEDGSSAQQGQGSGVRRARRGQMLRMLLRSMATVTLLAGAREPGLHTSPAPARRPAIATSGCSSSGRSSAPAVSRPRSMMRRCSSGRMPASNSQLRREPPPLASAQSTCGSRAQQGPARSNGRAAAIQAPKHPATQASRGALERSGRWLHGAARCRRLQSCPP